MQFQNKTVLISGGASGMGLLCGQCFARQGANVVLADINEQALKEKPLKLRLSAARRHLPCAMYGTTRR